MSRYILIRRLRGPAFLLLVGVNALLAQAHILGWGRSWPLYLILWGVLALAERAALTAEEAGMPPNYPAAPYPGAPYQGAPYQGAVDPNVPPPASPYTPQAETAIVPTRPQEMEKTHNGGQS